MQHVEHGPVDVLAERRVAVGERLTERRRGVEEFERHAGPLRPLPREHQHGIGTRRAGPRRQIRMRTALGQGVERGQRALPVLGDDSRPMLQLRHSTRGQRPPDERKFEVRGVAEQLPQPPRLTPQPRSAVRGQRQHDRPGRLQVPGIHYRFRLLQDDVRVRTTDPKGGDGRTPGPFHIRPLTRPVQQCDTTRGPIHVGGRGVEMQRARKHPVLQRLHHLDHTGDTGRGLGVPDVRLDGPEPQRPLGRPILTVRREQRFCLDRIPERRPGPVPLHDVDLVRRESRVGEGLADHALLGLPVGRAEPVGGAVLVDRGAADHSQHPVPVAPRVRQPLHHEGADALGERRTVRVVRVRPAPPRPPEHLLPAELDEAARRRHHRRPARQGEIALARTQRPHREMQRHQSCRARRVQRQRGPLQPVHIGDPAGQDTRRVPEQQMVGHALRRIGHPTRVVLLTRADEHARTAPAQRGRRDAGPFERLPRRLQQQPLMRIHGQRLTR